jgi:MFS transporter, DHA2 family, methylenomycin A resistance protein
MLTRVVRRQSRLSPPDSPDITGSSQWKVTALASVAAFVVQIDGSALNVALPVVGQSFGAPFSELQWIVDAYALAYSCLLLSAGAVGDRFGARRVFVWGLGAFLLASVLCALAPNVGLLVLGRVLQGAAGSILVPSSLALISHALGEDRAARTKAVGYWTASGGLAITAGPIVGALFIGYLGWRGIFLINIPICLTGMALASRRPAERPVTTVPLGHDLLGHALAMVSMLGLVGGIIEGGSRGWNPTFVFVGIAVFIVAGIIFVRRETRVPLPVLPLSLFGDRATCAVMMIGFVLSFCAFGVVFALSLYYQFVQEYSPAETGLAFVPFALTVTAANLIGAALAARIGPGRTIVGALVVGAIGYALLLRMETSSLYLEMLPAQLMARLGVGAAVPLTTSMLLSAVLAAQAGVASAALNTVRQAGAAIGVAVFGALMNGDPTRGFHVAVILSAVLLTTAAIGAAVRLGAPQGRPSRG